MSEGVVFVWMGDNPWGEGAKDILPVPSTVDKLDENKVSRDVICSPLPLGVRSPTCAWTAMMRGYARRARNFTVLGRRAATKEVRVLFPPLCGRSCSHHVIAERHVEAVTIDSARYSATVYQAA